MNILAKETMRLADMLGNASEIPSFYIASIRHNEKAGTTTFVLNDEHMVFLFMGNRGRDLHLGALARALGTHETATLARHEWMPDAKGVPQQTYQINRTATYDAATCSITVPGLLTQFPAERVAANLATAEHAR